MLLAKTHKYFISFGVMVVNMNAQSGKSDETWVSNLGYISGYAPNV